MADLSKTIAIIFSGVDELSGPINSITGSLDGFSANIEAIAAPLAGAADNVLKLDAAITALAFGGLVYSFNASKNFENSVIELQKVLGEGAGVDQAIADATRLSDIYGQSATDILLSTADFKQAGFDIAEAMELTAVSLDLVIAGNIGAAQSSELIIAALKGFGVEADSARQFIDILNEVSNNYATDVEQLATGMSKLSPIARAMGFSMEETAGLLVPVIEIFRSGDEAAIALRTGLLKLVDDSKPVQEALTAIGVSQFDLNGELRSGKDIFVDVATAFQSMDEEQKLFITQQLVGIQQSARMVTVFDNLALATEIASTAMDSAGSAAAEVAQRLQSAEVSVDRFKVGFENLAITIGDQFRLAVVEAIDGGTDIENALRSIIDGGTFEPVFDVINDFAGDVGALLSSIARDLPEAFENVNFDDLLDALGNVGEALGDMFDGVDLTTPEGLTEVIQNVIDSLASLANVTAGMIDAFRPFFQNIVGFIQSFNDLDVASQRSAGEIIGLAKAVVEAGTNIALAILLIGDGADDLAPIFGVVIRTISGAFDSIVVVWNGVKLAFITILDDLLAASQVFSRVALFGAFSEDIEANRRVLASWKDSVETNMESAADSAILNLTGITTNFADTGDSADKAAEDIKKVPTELDTIPSHKQTDITAETDADSIAFAKTAIEGAAPDEIVTDVSTETDQATLDKTKEDIDTAVPFEKSTTAVVRPDQPSINITKAAIDRGIPESKMIEIQLQGDIDTEIARIKSEAEMVQTAFEWTARVDIAEIEAGAKVAAAAFDSVAESVTATAAASADMFGSFIENINELGFVDKWLMLDLLKQQMAMEQQALDIQRDLTEAQIEYMQAKADALRDGDGLIKISSDGLEPALEMIMFQILEKIQLRVTEEAAEFLLGLGVTE